MLFRLRLLLDRFNPRERLLLLIILVLLVAALSQAVLWYSGITEHQAQRDRIEQLRQQYRQNQNTLSALQQAGQSPRIEALAAQNTQLEQQLEDLDRRLGTLTSDLIPPQTMVPLLRDLLDRDNLTLLTFNTRPVQALPRPDDQSPLLYRHALEIELRGSYTALLGYLESIEGLPWRLFWDEISIQTERYPDLNIRLRVHTLSDQEEWLNV